MKVVSIESIKGTNRDVKGEGFNSLRILLEKDNMGFSLHKTIIEPGTYHWHYKNHLEACYCICGVGCIKNLSDGISHVIIPDTTYVLNNNDEHIFTAETQVILISIFNPPVKGTEIHNKDGSYSI